MAIALFTLHNHTSKIALQTQKGYTSITSASDKNYGPFDDSFLAIHELLSVAEEELVSLFLFHPTA